jgi:hypothetical protein
MYYTATEGQQYEATIAKTISAAKRVASRRNPWAGVELSVAIKVHDGEFERFERVAKKRHGAWQDLV